MFTRNVLLTLWARQFDFHQDATMKDGMVWNYVMIITI